MEVLLLLLGLELALALNCQCVVFHADIQVLFVDTRNFKLQHDLLRIFIDIDRRHKTGSSHRVASVVQVAEKGVDSILQCNNLSKWVPTSDGYDCAPRN